MALHFSHIFLCETPLIAVRLGCLSASALAAEALLAASRYDRETVALTITATVASTYFQIVDLRERLSIARDNLANARKILRVVEARARDVVALTRPQRSSS